MSAPVIWIILPVVLAGALLFIRKENLLANIGGGFAILLALTAAFLPIDRALEIAGVSFRINSSLVFFGRAFTLTPASQSMLTIVYGLTSFWFFASQAVHISRRLVPIGLILTALLVASLAVQPFLYAAFIIEMAVLISIPMLSPADKKAGRGITQFLAYQSLAMPFILFAGFLLAGVEASPGDLGLVVQSAALLAIGFAFLLPVFPMHTWMPTLAEETHPYIISFIFLIFPLFGLFFGMGFLDRYAWMRESENLSFILRTAGMSMLILGGGWMAFESRLSRMMAYATIAEIGFALLAIGLPDQTVGVQLVFLTLLPRALGLGVWAICAAVIHLHLKTNNLSLASIQGLGRSLPFASVGIVIAQLSIFGLPLLAAFPVHLTLWEKLAQVSLTSAAGFGLGITGLLIGTIRTFNALINATTEKWQINETLPQSGLIALGVISLFALGLFPSLGQLLLAQLPNIFEHLGK